MHHVFGCFLTFLFMYKKLLSVFIFCAILHNVGLGQKRFNFKIDYMFGYQYSKNEQMISSNTRSLKADMPEGSFYQVNSVKPTPLNAITLSATIFKKKAIG